MKPVDQIILDDPDNGDCFRACVASLLELELKDVPNFAADGTNGSERWHAATSWLLNHGHRMVRVSASGLIGATPATLCIAGGASPRYAGTLHGVIVQLETNDEFIVLHDPHPSRDGIIGWPREFIFLIPIIAPEAQDYGR